MPPNLLRLFRVVVALGLLGSADSIQSAVMQQASDSPLTVTSQTMMYKGKEQKAFFERNVVLTEGDLVIHSDHMVMTFKPKSDRTPETSQEGGFGQKIKKAVATGNVVIEKSGGVATSGRAEYFKDEEKLILTESPVACQNGTRVTGLRITMYLKEDRSIAEGESRVTVVDRCDE